MDLPWFDVDNQFSSLETNILYAWVEYIDLDEGENNSYWDWGITFSDYEMVSINAYVYTMDEAKDEVEEMIGRVAPEHLDDIISSLEDESNVPD